ncbi:unnamed protein product, partial [Brassica oleracea]
MFAALFMCGLSSFVTTLKVSNVDALLLFSPHSWQLGNKCDSSCFLTLNRRSMVLSMEVFRFISSFVIISTGISKLVYKVDCQELTNLLSESWSYDVHRILLAIRSFIFSFVALHAHFACCCAYAMANSLACDVFLYDAEYSHTRAKGTCLHEKENTNIRTIDCLVIIDPIADVEFAQLVWQHHVVGTVPMWSDFIFTKRVFTGPSIDLVTNSFIQFLSWYSELTTVEGIIGLYKTAHEETGDKVAFIFFTENIEDGDFLCLWKFSTMRKRAI